jgi:HK97 family phage portal protein
MAEMTIFGALSKAATREKALTPVSTWRNGWRVISESYAGAWQKNEEIKVGDLTCYPTLYGCLNRISQDIGKLPFLLKEENEKGIWKVTKNPAYSPVLRNPNGYQTAQQFREAWVLSKLINGNTYVLKQRDERNVVVKLYILDPCRVIPMISENGSVFYQINYDVANNLLPAAYPAEQLVVPASEIIHDRLNCFHHQLIGVPPLCAAHWPTAKNMKILKSATEFFGNNSQPGGILTAPAGMSQPDADALKLYWQENYTGTNAGKIAVIGADMKFTPFAMKSADSQLVEQMRYSDEQICQPFGIPPFKIGIGEIPAGLGVDGINQLYYSDALQAHIEAMENLLDDGLRIERPLGVELDLWPLLRMDLGKQADVETKLTGGGIKTPNEGRHAFGLEPLEGGDTVYMQQQDFPLDQVRKNKIVDAPAAPTAPAEDEESLSDEEMDSEMEEDPEVEDA